MRKFGNLVFGAILGGLVGSSLALLFAPGPGEKTRRDIEEYFTNIKSEVNRAADEKRAELEAQLRNFKSGEGVTIDEETA